MTYELLLTGNKRIAITDQERQLIIEAEKRNKETHSDSWMTLGYNRFKLSMIKGIFFQDDEIRVNKSTWIKENQEWHETCTRMSKYDLEKKFDIEMKNRVIPGMKLSHIQLDAKERAVMEANIRMFLKQNPKYPRCPMRIWWPFIAEKIAPINPKTGRRANLKADVTSWWKIVARNDEAIEEWIRYN